MGANNGPLLGDRLLEERRVRAYQDNVDCRAQPSASILAARETKAEEPAHLRSDGAVTAAWVARPNKPLESTQE